MGKALAGQRALVTGASSGIGAELARELARRGASVVLTARRRERLEALAEELHREHGVEARVLCADLAAPDAPRELYERTEGAGLAVDILVNNAGFGAYEDFVKIPWERTRAMLQVNVVALTELTHRFLPGMIARRHGHVLNVASLGAYTPCPTFAVYAASKAYVRNLTEAIDFELRGTGVRATCVNPGGTRTEFLDAAGQRLKQAGEWSMMSAEACARIAVRKMLAGRRNVVTGFLNALSAFLFRFLPRPWLAWLAYQGLSSGVEKTAPLARLPAPEGPDGAVAAEGEEPDAGATVPDASAETGGGGASSGGAAASAAAEAPAADDDQR